MSYSLSNLFTVYISEIYAEMQPDKLPDVSAVADFDTSKLKHVDTKESKVLPSQEGKHISICLALFLISLI